MALTARIGRERRNGESLPGFARGSFDSYATAARALVPVLLALVLASDAAAICDVIPQPQTIFRGATASANRVFATEDEPIVLTRDSAGCDAGTPAFQPTAANNLVTLLYTPPNASKTAVVIGPAGYCAGAWVSNAYEAACETQLGAGGQAFCEEASVAVNGGVLSFPLRTQGRAGPVKIVTSATGAAPPCQLATQACSGASGLSACIDELYASDGTCETAVANRDAGFPGFTALPSPNDFSGICDSPDPSIPCSDSGADVGFTTDAAGNVVVPMDWAGVLVPGTLPIPRLVRASTSVAAFTGAPPEPNQTPGAPIAVPGLGFLQSFSPKGLGVDPLFSPLFNSQGADTELFGSADAERGVIRILRRSLKFRECKAGSRGGLACIANFECPGSSCGPGKCRGGSQAGKQCSNDTMCLGGECGPSNFEFRNRYSTVSGSAGVGPVLLTSAEYTAEAENPAAIDGLVSTPDLFMFVRSEPIESSDLNLDGDEQDATIVTLRDAATGEDHEIGAVPGAVGRASTRARFTPFSFPAVAVEDDVLAFLEAEPYEGAADSNADNDALDTVLRIFRLESGGPVELSASTPETADAMTRVDRASLALSDGLVFFRAWELAATPKSIAFVSHELGVPNAILERSEITPDGRFVVFHSTATNLVGSDTNAWEDIFVYDRDTDADGVYDEGGSVATRRVSITTAGTQASCPVCTPPSRPHGPSITPDGRHVVFQTVLPLSADFPNTLDTYVHDRDTDADGVFDEPGAIKTTRVTSTSSPGALASTISDDARWVAYSFSDTSVDLLMHDRDADADGIFDEPGATATYPLLQTTLGVVPDGSSAGPTLSEDGRHVTFGSWAGNLGVDPTPFFPDVFALDRDADGDGVLDELGAVALTLVLPAGIDTSQIPPGIDTSEMSGDGRFVTSLVGGPGMAPNAIADRDVDEDGILDEPGSTEIRLIPLPQSTLPTRLPPLLEPSGRFALVESSGGPGRHYGVADVEAGTAGTVTASPVAISGPARAAISSLAKHVVYGHPLLVVSGIDTNDFSADLNSDGDIDDAVLAVADARLAAPIPITLVAAADRVAVHAGHAAFLRPESADGAGVVLNSDGDALDQVVHLWRNRQVGAPVNLGRAAKQVALSSQYVAALVSEVGEGAILNGDGDQLDTVVHVNPLPTATSGTWTNLAFAADSVQVTGPWVAFTVVESAQGADQNGDADLGDRVLRIYNAQTAQYLQLENELGVPIGNLAVDDFVLGDEIVAFRVNEFAQGQNRNGVVPPIPGGVADGDLFDSVMHVASLATGRVDNAQQAAIPCPVEACDPRVPYRITGTKVTYLTLEAQQGGNDLDQNGDGGIGLVLQHFNASALAAGGSQEDASDLLGGSLAGVCTTTAESCASDADCAGETCYFPPGGCLFDTGNSCNPDTGSGCTGSQFCVPLLGMPGSGTCHVFQGPCLTDGECTAPALCTDNGADPEQLFAAVSEQPDGRQRYVSIGRCSDGDGSCSHDGHCSPGSTCEAVTVTTTAPDTDADGQADPIDNCPDRANEAQSDTDADGTGDACDRETCGNAIQEYAETCDDGDQTSGDGCSDICAIEGATPACSNGLDDDGDARVDFPSDTGCTGAGDTSERQSTKICDDGVDNDGDYGVDVPGDPGCANPNSTVEAPACSNGIDDDNDGKVDFDGGGFGLPDPQCGTASKNKEKASGGGGCGLGLELVLLAPVLARARRRHRVG